jgi:hypothetical protein
MNAESQTSDFGGSSHRPSRKSRIRTPFFAALLVASGACAMSNDAPAGEGKKQDGRVTVVGRLTGEGVECQALRGDDGQLYTLLGNIGSLPVETRVCVSGERMEASTCQQGVTIKVRSIAPADSCKS